MKFSRHLLNHHSTIIELYRSRYIAFGGDVSVGGGVGAIVVEDN